MRRVAKVNSAVVAGGLSCSPASSTGAAGFAVCTSRDGRVRLFGPSPASGPGEGLLPVLGDAAIGTHLTCASAGLGRVTTVSGGLSESGGVVRWHKQFLLQDGTVTVAAGGADGALRFCAFALGPVGATGARLLLQRCDSLPCDDAASGAGPADLVPPAPPLEASVEWAARAAPLSSVAAHHEAADVVATGSESGRVAVVSLDLAAAAASGGAARLLWSAAAPAGVPILAAQVCASLQRRD